MIYNARPGGGGSDGYNLVTLTTNIKSASLTNNNPTVDFTVNYKGDGVLTATSKDTSIATVSLVSEKTYRITSIGMGNTTIIVEASIGSKTIPANKIEIAVSCILGSDILNENGWDVISAISEAGLASEYWDVGDCKAVTLNGTVGTLSLSNTTLYVFILGFDHNGSSGITFGGFKTALTSGIDVTLIDSGYSSQKTSGTWFNMSNSNSNIGGWKRCRMRYYVLGSTDNSSSDASDTTATNPVPDTLMAALPLDLRTVMKPMTIYSDNTGGGSDTGSYVTATKDYLPLLAEFEVFGSRKYANSAEQNNQAQYAYYQQGNDTIKSRHNAIDSEAWWWLRSVHSESSGVFCGVHSRGTVTGYSAYASGGVAPAFLV